uniref:Ribosomal protein S3 n=1 Tax=Pyropia kanakaensis TaxID=139729 RepID=A0A060DCN7_9RHOD|nr:ribosomal protein S3 [Pyropia kanakaensis]AIB08158.1 ribosomal protein S3 [Pyropia kanakaensis]AIB08216.1 ribosomal protein S3 [Pyropia kanakaensis]
MGQKVNPRGFRIGINSLWHTESQCYGKSFINSKRLYKKILPTTNFLTKLLESKMCIRGEIQSKIKDNKWQHRVQYVSLLSQNSLDIQVGEKIAPSVFSIELLKYNTTFWYRNGSLICEFIKFSLKKGIAFRKIVTAIKMFFLNKKKYNLVLKTVCGQQLFEFMGIKIKYVGRFGGSRSRMSNSVVFRTGAVPLQKLNTYIEFYETPLYTKQGVCNLKVWVAYKTI